MVGQNALQEERRLTLCEGGLKLLGCHTFERLDAIYACHTPDQLS